MQYQFYLWTHIHILTFFLQNAVKKIYILIKCYWKWYKYIRRMIRQDVLDSRMHVLQANIFELQCTHKI